MSATDSLFDALETDGQEWYEALSMMSYHGTSWGGVAADMNEEDVKRTLELLRRQGDGLRLLRRTLQAILQNATSYHALEDGKARALTMIGSWAADALDGHMHESVNLITSEARRV
jgi:hypothetical protein